MNQPKPTIVLIGAGNLATNLGKALKQKEYPIAQVYSRTEASAKQLATLLGTSWTTSLDTIRRDASLYIVALKDKVLIEWASRLAVICPDAIFVHTAGSISIDIWKGHLSKYGVFYPMQTFSKERESDFNHLPIFLEASDSDTLSFLRKIAQSLSTAVYELNSEQRRYLHLGAVFACNFTNHLYTLTAQLLQAHHIPFEVMLPLIDETAAKVHHLSPEKAQTGPAVRYDTNVIDQQIALLADYPELQHIYRELSESIHKHHSNP